MLTLLRSELETDSQAIEFYFLNLQLYQYAKNIKFSISEVERF